MDNRFTARPIAIDPRLQIVPVLGLDEQGIAKEFLGTGAFVGKPPYLVTAKHVLKLWNKSFGIGVPISGSLSIIQAIPASLDSKVDLALLEVPGYQPNLSFVLADDDEIHTNLLVCCLEYSRSRWGQQPEIEPATRIGNITRLLRLTKFTEKAGSDALELSFPILKGASGAPIFERETRRLWGIGIANIDYELLPAWIETSLDDENKILEEVKYLLPQGVAVHVKHLRALLTQAQGH